MKRWMRSDSYSICSKSVYSFRDGKARQASQTAKPTAINPPSAPATAKAKLSGKPIRDGLYDRRSSICRTATPLEAIHSQNMDATTIFADPIKPITTSHFRIDKLLSMIYATTGQCKFFMFRHSMIQKASLARHRSPPPSQTQRYL